METYVGEQTNSMWRCSRTYLGSGLRDVASESGSGSFFGLGLNQALDDFQWSFFHFQFGGATSRANLKFGQNVIGSFLTLMQYIC